MRESKTELIQEIIIYPIYKMAYSCDVDTSLNAKRYIYIYIPADKWRNSNVIITLKRHRNLVLT